MKARVFSSWTHANAARHWLVAAICVVTAACSSNPEKSAAASPSDAGLEERVLRDVQSPEEELVDAGRTYAPTYTAVWYEIIVPRCGNSFCHGGNDNSFVISTKETTYQSPTGFIGAKAGGVDCVKTGLWHIDPGHPESSLIYLKLIDPPPCGVRMPNLPGALGHLDPRDIEQVRSWIELGARDD